MQKWPLARRMMDVIARLGATGPEPATCSWRRWLAIAFGQMVARQTFQYLQRGRAPPAVRIAGPGARPGAGPGARLVLAWRAPEIWPRVGARAPITRRPAGAQQIIVAPPLWPRFIGPAPY